MSTKINGQSSSHVQPAPVAEPVKTVKIAANQPAPKLFTADLSPKTVLHELKEKGSLVARNLNNLPKAIDNAWGKLVDGVYNGSNQAARQFGDKLQVRENIAALGAGDSYKLALGVDGTIGFIKGAAKGELNVRRTDDGKGFEVSASGRLSAGGAIGLDKLIPKLKGSPISGDADALRGQVGNIDFKFANADEAKRAAVLIAHAARDGAKLDNPISAQDAKWLRQHISGVELRGELSAQVSAGLSKPNAKAFAGLYTKDKITQTDSVRLEFSGGRPTSIVTRSELKGEGRLGLGFGFKGADKFKGNTNSVFGGSGEVKVSATRRYELPANLKTGDFWKAVENPKQTAGGIARIVRNAVDTVTVQAYGQTDAARNGKGGEVTLRMRGKANFYSDPQALGKLFKGDLPGALRELPKNTSVGLWLTPIERKGVFGNPSLTVPGVKIGAEIESIRTDRKVESEIKFTGRAGDAATALEDFGKKVIDGAAKLPFGAPQTSTNPVRPVAQPAAKVPSADELIQSYAKFAKFRTLTNEEKSSLKNLNPLERQMYQATLGELAALQSGKVNAARYFVDVLKKAEQLSGGDGGKFVNLVGMAFSASPSSGPEETVRNFLGTGGNRAGSTLEGLQRKILDSDPNLRASHQGFNPNVINTSKAIEDQVRRGGPTDTITHHFREFFLGGYQTSGAFDPRRGTAFDTAITIDDGRPNPNGIRQGRFGIPTGFTQTGESAGTRNEGDIRNGLFATMIGQGLRDGKITPRQAVSLIENAFVAGQKNSPLWGDTAQTGTVQNPSQWANKNRFDSPDDLQRWLNNQK